MRAEREVARVPFLPTHSARCTTELTALRGQLSERSFPSPLSISILCRRRRRYKKGGVGRGKSPWEGYCGRVAGRGFLLSDRRNSRAAVDCSYRDGKAPSYFFSTRPPAWHVPKNVWESLGYEKKKEPRTLFSPPVPSRVFPENVLLRFNFFVLVKVSPLIASACPGGGAARPGHTAAGLRSSAPGGCGR